MNQSQRQTRHANATNLHRLFIQSMLSRRALKEDIALEMYKRAVGACRAVDDTFRPLHETTLRGFRTFLSDVSDLLHDLGMEVITGQEQTGKGKSWVVLRNIDPSEVAMQATDYTPLEIDYYRRVVKEIIESYPANSVSHGQALTVVSELEGHMTKHSGEALLNSFCSRGWLSKSKRGRYTLGVRAAIELEPYLKQQFEEYIQNCKHCKRLMLDGVCCTTDGCESHFHSYCYASLQKLPRPSCPGCKALFAENEPTPIGEKSVPKADDDFINLRTRKRARPSTQSQVNGKVNGKGKNRAAQNGDNGDTEDDDDDNDEDEDELEDEEGAIITRRNGSGRGSGFIERAGPSDWRVDSSSRPRRSQTQRRSYVPETQFDDDDDDEDDDDARQEEEEEEEPPKSRRRSRRYAE
ncbi:uncharacterized protein I303_100898 [Kwoniella dejecticola CBS 10117]|uniref:Non-structural maintenance of chromosomes element 1 homolog n=1 Tax=Kwoniella dejecticola CBS 10117 TaxID=1296121 RepID=A0A1A6AG79_9TREE|nr:uncharacterized protein I303_00902 [Kwoniella dejecticola CBS 10117]OBR89080.1 hypothetical protein I303_00902 [Kwoniella dejecticola CBS 10117]